VPLDGDASYELTRGVGFSYATREAKQFVLSFAPQYLAACGTPLTVTSAARPTSRQPRNSNPYSVHPTGIAIDLRRPSAGPCQTWLRNALGRAGAARGTSRRPEERPPRAPARGRAHGAGKIAALPPAGSGVLAGAQPRAQRSERRGRAALDDTDPSRLQCSGAEREPTAMTRRFAAATYRVREGDTFLGRRTPERRECERTGTTPIAGARAAY
jgi:hypothetical protein